MQPLSPHLDVTHRLLGGRCPNCGGERVKRPIRPVGKLAKFPTSTQRVNKAHVGCSADRLING